MMATTITQAVKWIQSGFVVVAPLEHGYVFLVDAFDHDAVRTMHTLRGDALGVSAQVLVANIGAAGGITREISPEAHTLMDEFWPGLLTLNVAPQVGLTWDLGDDRKLDAISLRVPAAEFVGKVLKKTGPLACASAAKAGSAPILKVEDIENLKSDILRVCDFGELEPGPASTVVIVKATSVVMIREGAISFEELALAVPKISRAKAANS